MIHGPLIYNNKNNLKKKCYNDKFTVRNEIINRSNDDIKKKEFYLKYLLEKYTSISQYTIVKLFLSHKIENNNIWIPLTNTPKWTGGQSEIFILYKIVKDKNFSFECAIAKNFKDDDNFILENRIFNIIQKKSDKLGKDIYNRYVPKKLGTTNAIVDNKKKKFLVIEYIDGITLSKLINSKNISEELVKRIFTQLCEVIGFFHNIGLAHRDLKPQNIMITGKKDNDGKYIENTIQIKLIDFGLSYYSKKKKNCFDSVGTINYCAPEIFSDSDNGYDSYSSDLWSLGIILFSMINFHSPYITPVENNDMFLDFINKERYSENDKLNYIIKSLCDIDPDKRMSCENVIEILKD